MEAVEASVTKASGTVESGCARRAVRLSCFTLVESCDECCGPGDGMEALSSGAGKDVMKRGLNRNCVGKKTSIEI